MVVGREAQGGGLSYVDPGLDPVFRGTLGEDLTLRLGSGGCNTTRGRDRIEINVVSRRTGGPQANTARCVRPSGRARALAPVTN